MKHDFSKDLFNKYVEGNCTEDEKAIVEGWYLNELKKSDFVPHREELNVVQEQIWNNIRPEKKQYPFIRWIAYAAAVVIAVLFVYKFQTGKNVEVPAYVRTATTEPVAKDSVIIAPANENSMMKLPDGSVIILEKGSKLTVLSAFNKKHNREVELEGKAFFDIAHNPSKPFIIYTGSVRTTVLGTSFDITAPMGTKSVKVNVIRGLVEVKNMKSHWMTYLKKNMQVVSDDVRMVRKVVDAEKELSWNNREGIIFNDITFKDAKKILEDRYNVQIHMKDAELQDSKFTTSLKSGESLDHFLAIICAYNNAQHTFNSDSTEVSIKPLNHN